MAGADRVLLGSDYPFDMSVSDPVAKLGTLLPGRTCRHNGWERRGTVGAEHVVTAHDLDHTIAGPDEAEKILDLR